ncbi:hypothetical protein [Microcoleus sp. CAWBG640]|uniref:hypothetical protein n=1 Tax=Microcoleus sp. CAWBG640 TaxID=2841653 RepID=UPI00312B51DD
MSDQPENNQILTQHPETIATLESNSQPSETPPETSLDEYSLITESQPSETPPETSLDEYSLITDSQPATTPPENSLDEEHSLTTDFEPLDFSRENLITANISHLNPDTKTTTEPAIKEDILSTQIQSENSAETAIREDILMANLETETETIPMAADIAPPTIDYDNYPTQLNPTPNPEPKKTGVWQVLAVFLSGMLVGSVLSLGSLLAWRMYQERVNLQIKLPADVPLRPSPSPIPATPANRLPAIPPAPATPQSPVSTIPSPTPTLTPTLSGVPQLASPSPSASAFPSPSVSPSPAAQTDVTERVSFEPGAIGVTLRNTLPDNKSKRYLLECNSGQSMTLKVEEGKVSAAIIAPNGEKVGTANSTSPWQGQLPSSGDYTIELSGDNKANYGVKIEVK